MRVATIACVAFALSAGSAIAQQPPLPGYYYPPGTSSSPYGQTITGSANNSGQYIIPSPSTTPSPSVSSPSYGTTPLTTSPSVGGYGSPRR